jgi:hypothetical protein
VSGFRLKGFSRLGLAALLANQLILIICAIQGTILAPIFAMVSTAVLFWWQWIHNSTGHPSTPADRRQFYFASFVLGIPVLWVGLISSGHKLQSDLPAAEWLLNIASLSLTVVVFLILGFRHVWNTFATSR